MASILLTGIGLISKHLAPILESNGHEVSFLSRSKKEYKNYKVYYWNHNKQVIDSNAIKNTDIIIHLAGASISKRWTKKFKREIYDSRINSTKFLCEYLRTNKHRVKQFILGSAIGYYGSVTTDKIFSESDSAGNDFLARICIKWEKSLDDLPSGINNSIIRTGVVFSKNDGPFTKICQPIKKGFGAVIGNGKQIISWIHIEDYCNMMLYMVMNSKLNGIYNAVAPYPVSNKELTYRISRKLNKSIWLPAVPKFALKIILGQMSILATEGNVVNSEKISNTGFEFKYPYIEDALNNLLD
ncbi:TIGR01777 family oxidoreductase [Urechidicola sp. KH5]